MHGFGPVADGCRTQADVFEESHDSHSLLGRALAVSDKEFIADLADGLAVSAYDHVRLEVFFARHRYHQTACDVFRQSDDLIWESGDVLLADVCQKQVDDVAAGFGRVTFGGALGAAAVGYRTESMHGAGSPQAQRIMIQRQGNIEGKKALAKAIAGIK